MISRRRFLTLGMATAVVLHNPALAFGRKKRPPLDASGWKTYCIGRFLVDVPPNANVSGIYEIWGHNIERLILSLRAAITTRENVNE